MRLLKQRYNLIYLLLVNRKFGRKNDETKKNIGNRCLRKPRAVCL